ncbi:MAG: site-specific DNA-methyltransferase [Methanoregula sp.]|jgi:site-specific DNA-methyltransferase (adenine-specific)|nr:site-specific DNA-methyltransferase [Methanoregula sp.]
MKRRLGAFRQNTLYLGDALALMPEIPDGSIDLIVTDPPFAINFKAHRLNYNRTDGNVLEGYREVPEAEYGEFTTRWITEAARTLAPTGSMYIFSGWNRLRDILEGIDNAGLTTINHLIWKYQFGVYTKKKYVTSHYHILFVVKDPKHYTFNKIDHYPEDVWVIQREYWKGKKKTPTKLPSEIVRKILLYSSNPGDLVLDPFFGSGTVPVISQKEGRHFLGFEIAPEYFSFAIDSLQSDLRR